MILNLTKMHGIGNDFILMDDRASRIESETDYSELAKKLCKRRFGLGADGLIIACSSMTHDIKFRIFNSDGTEPEMCGNGIRCFGKYVYERSIHIQTIMNVETKAGTIVPLLNVNDEGVVDSVSVDMGEPVLEAGDIPCTLNESGKIISEKLEACGNSFEVTAVSMGNPHAVVFVDDDIDDDLFFCAGPFIENSQYFPKNTNVEFVKVISEEEISIRVWERGVGETLACGTGACAAVVASVLNEKTSRGVKVRLKGGDLNVKWNENNNHIYKTGPAAIVYDTHVDLERVKNDL